MELITNDTKEMPTYDWYSISITNEETTVERTNKVIEMELH